MKSRYGWLKQTALMLTLLAGSAAAMAFPEIPFCPLGGPPGWWNRVTDDDHYYYPPPPYLPPPPAVPYLNPAFPYHQLPDLRYQPPPVNGP